MRLVWEHRTEPVFLAIAGLVPPLTSRAGKIGGAKGIHMGLHNKHTAVAYIKPSMYPLEGF